MTRPSNLRPTDPLLHAGDTIEAFDSEPFDQGDPEPQQQVAPAAAVEDMQAVEVEDVQDVAVSLADIPPRTPEFIFNLFQYLQLVANDPNSATHWVDDFTFKMGNYEVALQAYFGLESIEQFRSQCRHYGMIEVENNTWRHRDNFFCRNRPELLGSTRRRAASNRRAA